MLKTLSKKMIGILVLIFIGVLSVILVVGCKGGSSSASNYPKGNLDFVAPAGAGGGWDLTIRTVAKVLGDSKIVSVPMPVRNAPGAGGAVHLGTMQTKKGDDRTITVYSPPLILINLNGTTEYSFRNLTPLARLIADYGAFVVKSDSPYKSIMDVMDALKKDPKSVKIGGTSAAGSMDHVQFLIMAKAAGVPNLNKIDYIAFDDDGATQVLGGHIDLFSTSLADVMGLVESGDLRVLAQTSDKRIGTGIKGQIPTCIESGINETFVNWRGLFGAPEMPEYAVTYWSDALQKMSGTQEWKDVCARYGWDEAYMNSADFTKFLEQTEQDYSTILKEIGMLKN